MVRLDTLSLPKLYDNNCAPTFSLSEEEWEYPAGYARIRLLGDTLNTWKEYATSSGYLRRFNRLLIQTCCLCFKHPVSSSSN